MLGAACTAAKPAATEDITVWRPLGKWSGSAVLQTDPFSSNTGLLRIVWEARTRTPDVPGSLRIVLHSDVSGRSLAPVVDQKGPGGGVKYIAEDPRAFFLVIDSSGLEWSVDAAEGVAATRAKPR